MTPLSVAIGAVEIIRARLDRRAFAAIGLLLIAALVAFILFRPGEQDSAGVELGDPHAWVEHGIGGELLQINASTGEVTARIEVSEPGEQILAVPHGDGAVVLNDNNNSISLISGTLLAVTANIPIEVEEEAEVSPEDLDDNELDTTPDEERDRQLFGSPDDTGNVVVVSGDEVRSIDPQSQAQTPIALADPLLSVIQDGQGAVVALPASADEVLRLGPQGLGDATVLSSPVEEASDTQGRALVRAGGSTYIIDPSRLSINELLADGSLGLPFCATSAAVGAIPGGTGPNDDPMILAYNPSSSVLNVSEPGEGCRDISVDIEGDLFGSPVAAGGVAYIPNWGNGRIIVVDLDEEEVVASYPFGRSGTPFELDVVGDTVWANEPQGPFAAVVDAETITPVPKIDTIVAGAAEIASEGDGAAIIGAAIDGGGLRVIGDTGDAVVSTDDDEDGGTGDGSTPGDDPGDLFDPGEEPTINEPLAVGIQIDQIDVEPEPVTIPEADPEPEPQPEADANVEVAETLLANFSVSSGSVAEDEIIRFSDTSTGSPTSWTWDFGDGTGINDEPDVEKSWAREGTYIVTMTVTNSAGAQSSRAVEIVVVPKEVLLPPSADFIFDRNTIEVGDSVTFTDRSTGQVDQLSWDFGDGASSVGETASRTFDTVGTFRVTLTASNAAGSDVASINVNVISGVSPPRAVIAPVATNVVTGQALTLTSASENDPTSETWNLDDGTIASGPSVRHSWSTPGTYRVRLTVENSEGTDSTFIDVRVTQRLEPPISQFTQSATEVEVGEVVTFTNLSLNDPDRLIWGFGDDTFANGQTRRRAGHPRAPTASHFGRQMRLGRIGRVLLFASSAPSMRPWRASLRIASPSLPTLVSPSKTPRQTIRRGGPGTLVTPGCRAIRARRTSGPARAHTRFDLPLRMRAARRQPSARLSLRTCRARTSGGR